MGVKSLLVVKSFKLAKNREKEILRKYIGKRDLTQKEANQIRNIITKVGGRSYCENVLRERGKEALSILERIKKDIYFNSWEYLEDLVRFRLGLE